MRFLRARGKVKNIHILLICCSAIALSISGCSKVTGQENPVVKEAKTDTTADAESNTTVVIDDLELHIPSSWTICGNRMFSDDTPVIAVDINDFDEKRLKKEFQEDTEACIKSLLPNGIYLQNNSANLKNVNGFSIYEFVCTADKYSVKDDMFVMSDDIVYLDYLIPPDENKVYCLYFMNDMACKENVESFLEKVEKTTVIVNKDEQYKWMIAE